MSKKKEKFPENDGYRHYYLRDANHQPFGCVAFKPLPVAGTVVRGISLCSDQDQWTREAGRSKAVGRCKKAEATKLNNDPIQDGHKSASKFIMLFGTEFNAELVLEDGSKVVLPCKTCFGVSPTTREARILTKDAEYAARAKPDATVNA